MARVGRVLGLSSDQALDFVRDLDRIFVLPCSDDGPADRPQHNRYLRIPFDVPLELGEPIGEV